MRFSPEIRLARQFSSHFVLVTALLTFALSLLLTACGGVNASMPSSQPNAPATPTEKSPLSLAPAMINFGTVQLNSKVATSVVRVTNVGPFAETITSATILPNSIFSIQGWTGSVTLDPGQTFQLRTIFNPKSAGNYSGTLTLVTMGAAPVEYSASSVISIPTRPLPLLGQVSIPVIAVSTENSGSPLPAVGISVSPGSVALQSGQSKQFAATVTGTSNTAVTWTAVLGSISSSGIYTAPTVTSQSYDTVSAISVADSTKSASVSVTVTSASSVPIVGISVSPISLALQSGQSKQFTSAVTGTSNTAVTWTAVLGSISSSGDYTAPAVTSQSYDTVSAISVADSTKYASSAVTVTIKSTSSTGTPYYSQNANSVTTKVLPSDVLQHCFGDTSNCATGDLIAKCAMLDCNETGSDPITYNYSELSNPTYMGLFVKASPGKDDFGLPLYNPLPTDPWYSMLVTTPTGAQTIKFHAPNAATFSGGTEHLLAVWDQSTGYVVGMYGGGGGNYNVTTLPAASGCGSTSATACVIPTYDEGASTNMFTAQDYYYSNAPGGNGLGAYSSNGFAPFAGTLREQELMNGVINHAGMITLHCVSAITNYVFPANRNPGICGTVDNDGSTLGTNNIYRSSSGQLLFCDYTPAQIASFNLPAWQASLLTQFCTYGDYVSESGGYGITLVGDENIESSQAWASNGLNPLTADPFWPWITTQKGLRGDANITETGCGGGSTDISGSSPNSVYRCTGAFLANIPRAIGPEGSDAEGNSCTTGGGCYPSGHIHVADKCIAEGYAGVAGGCF